MQPKDPTTLSDEELERRLEAAAAARNADTRLVVSEQDDSSWRADFREFKEIHADLAPGGIVVIGLEGASSRRQALDQLWLTLDVQDDLAEYRARRDA